MDSQKRKCEKASAYITKDRTKMTDHSEREDKKGTKGYETKQWKRDLQKGLL
jgi:hypothetical protein